MTDQQHVCPECQEIAHDTDCPLVGDGRPVEGEPRHGPENQAWADDVARSRNTPEALDRWRRYVNR